MKSGGKILATGLKLEVYEVEFKKLNEIFSELEQPKKHLIDGLIEETAYVKSELYNMRCILKETGMLKIHPVKRDIQKTLPIANEYRRTLNVYSLNIKVLNSILNKDILGNEEDSSPFEEWLKSNGKE